MSNTIDQATIWQTLIYAAQAKGYKVVQCPDAGWLVITPKAPRRPSEELGSFPDERAAWRGAAWMANNN